MTERTRAAWRLSHRARTDPGLPAGRHAPREGPVAGASGALVAYVGCGDSQAAAHVPNYLFMVVDVPYLIKSSTFATSGLQWKTNDILMPTRVPNVEAPASQVSCEESPTLTAPTAVMEVCPPHAGPPRARLCPSDRGMSGHRRRCDCDTRPGDSFAGSARFAARGARRARRVRALASLSIVASCRHYIGRFWNLPHPSEVREIPPITEGQRNRSCASTTPHFGRAFAERCGSATS